MKLVEEVKSHSSKLIKIKGNQYSQFYWQNGYGDFSDHKSQINMISEYIRNQKEHHKKATFKDEYRSLLKDVNIDYDEQYVWD